MVVAGDASPMGRGAVKKVSTGVDAGAAWRDLDASAAEFCSLELRFALLPWLRSSSEAAWGQALAEMACLGIEDLQGLRREANKRLLPEATLHSMLQAAHKEGRLAKAQSSAAASRCALPWPGPEGEAALMALAERIIALEDLKELVRSRWPEAGDQRRACTELLALGVGSAAGVLELEPGVLEDVELSSLAADARRRIEEGDEERLARRCELLRCGPEPFLATAPHNAFLRRDGQVMHTLEEFTSVLAKRLARELGGSSLCWTQAAQWSTELRVALGHRRKAEGTIAVVGEALDPANRDPNYLLPEELLGNAWFCQMRSWAAEMCGVDPTQDRCMLHVDVHGCQDPPKHPAHAMLGLGAMRQRAEELPIGHPEQQRVRSRMQTFARALEDSVSAVLGPLLGVTAKEAVILTGLAPAVNERGEHVMTLSGAWPLEFQRLTQTQQSISHAGISHALQLELSRSARHALVKDLDAMTGLAHAIHGSWLEALRPEPHACPS